MHDLDERDTELAAARLAARSADGVQVGEWIDFADGVQRRVSHVWRGDWHDDPELGDGVQTSDGGSWYLGHGYASFSGSLYVSVRAAHLELTEETRGGSCWMFHHDHHRAHNAVGVLAPWRVWRCDLPAPRS